jgi:hypothetical protein
MLAAQSDNRSTTLASTVFFLMGDEVADTEVACFGIKGVVSESS